MTQQTPHPPHPPRPLRHEPLTLSDAPLAVTARAALLRAVPAGAEVRQAADSLRSVLSGFEPQRLGPANGQQWWPISGGRLPRPPLTSETDCAPRQLLRATASAALAPGLWGLRWDSRRTARIRGRGVSSSHDGAGPGPA